MSSRSRVHSPLCNPMDCSPPRSSVHGILQAKVLEWVAIPFSLPDPGIEPVSLPGPRLLHWQASSLALVPPRNPPLTSVIILSVCTSQQSTLAFQSSSDMQSRCPGDSLKKQASDVCRSAETIAQAIQISFFPPVDLITFGTSKQRTPSPALHAAVCALFCQGSSLGGGVEGWENPKWKSRLENLASGVSLISRKQGKLISMARQASKDGSACPSLSPSRTLHSGHR